MEICQSTVGNVCLSSFQRWILSQVDPGIIGKMVGAPWDGGPLAVELPKKPFKRVHFPYNCYGFQHWMGPYEFHHFVGFLCILGFKDVLGIRQDLQISKGKCVVDFKGYHSCDLPNIPKKCRVALSGKLRCKLASMHNRLMQKHTFGLTLHPGSVSDSSSLSLSPTCSCTIAGGLKKNMTSLKGHVFHDWRPQPDMDRALRIPSETRIPSHSWNHPIVSLAKKRYQLHVGYRFSMFVLQQIIFK